MMKISCSNYAISGKVKIVHTYFLFKIIGTIEYRLNISFPAEMIIEFVLFLLGLVALIKGADWFVDSSSNLARKFGISELVIGLTVVAFGTSSPELIVSLLSAWNGSADIVLGNVIGSNNFNLFFILGVTGLITPLVVSSSTVWKEIPISLFSAISIFILALYINYDDINSLNRFDGVLFIFSFLGFLYFIYRSISNDASEIIVSQAEPSRHIYFFLLVGFLLLILGGHLMVSNAVSIARTLHISEKIIGLTIVAVGTSLPELATSIVAARAKKVDIAVANIIGSNIFNILFILSSSLLFAPIVWTGAFNFDLILLIFGTLFLFLAMFTGEKMKLDRWEALVLLSTFVVYTTFLIVQEF